VTGAHGSASVTHRGETMATLDDTVGVPMAFNPLAENVVVMGGDQVGEWRRQVVLASASAPLTNGPLYLIFQLKNNCQNRIIHRKNS
jgi:hypothetical protein